MLCGLDKSLHPNVTLTDCEFVNKASETSETLLEINYNNKLREHQCNLLR
jgi:hypothetical protein